MDIGWWGRQSSVENLLRMIKTNERTNEKLQCGKRNRKNETHVVGSVVVGLTLVGPSVVGLSLVGLADVGLDVVGPTVRSKLKLKLISIVGIVDADGRLVGA